MKRFFICILYIFESLYGVRLFTVDKLLFPVMILEISYRRIKMASDRDIVEKYFVRLKKTIDEFPRDTIQQTIDVLRKARENKKMIFLFGNGGSAANASHIVNDLIKNTRRKDLLDFRMLALNENMSTFSAYANDYGYDTVFEGQLRSYASPGDVVMAFSTSGNSPNVVKAVQAAKEMGVTTIGFTGTTGGKLKNMVDICVHTPSDYCGIIEDGAIILGHIFTIIFSENNDMITEQMMK